MTAREFMAKRLREMRRARGLSANEVGAALGKKGKTINAWEVGHGQPDADALVKICNLYKVRISDFYDARAFEDGESRLLHVSPDERDLIDLYRALDTDAKDAVLRIFERMAERL